MQSEGGEGERDLSEGGEGEGSGSGVTLAFFTQVGIPCAARVQFNANPSTSVESKILCP